jgi:hypothetical protein
LEELEVSAADVLLSLPQPASPSTATAPATIAARAHQRDGLLTMSPPLFRHRGSSHHEDHRRRP